jgi:hypothetical protein
MSISCTPAQLKYLNKLIIMHCDKLTLKKLKKEGVLKREIVEAVILALLNIFYLDLDGTELSMGKVSDLINRLVNVNVRIVYPGLELVRVVMICGEVIDFEVPKL